MPYRTYEVEVVILNDEDGNLSVLFKAPCETVSEGELIDYMGIWNIDVDVEWGDERTLSQQVVRMRVRAKMLGEEFLNWGHTLLHYVNDPGMGESWRFVLQLSSRVRFIPDVGYREDGFHVELERSRNYRSLAR